MFIIQNILKLKIVQLFDLVTPSVLILLFDLLKYYKLNSAVR